MAYTAAELITSSLYLSGLVAREIEVPTGDQLSDGLSLLNDVLSIKTANLALISFFKEYDFDAVIGQEKYFIPGLLEIEFVTFNLMGPLRFPTRYTSRHEYFGSARLDNLQTLIGQWRPERTNGGTDLYLYPLPSDEFPIKLWGKFGLDSVEYETDLSLVYERVYRTYLRYALAKFICDENMITFGPDKYRELLKMESIIHNISPPDMTQRTINAFPSKPMGDIYLQANLALGWTT